MIQPPFSEIKEHYEWFTPKIMEAQSKHIRRWVSPYCHIRWELYFTPIEEWTWMALRSFGKAPFYPQYPVQNYFLDFGNPFTKIAIECDGKEFHKDKQRDKIRDKNLYKDGWIVYRISGSDCFRTPTDEYYDLSYQPEEEQKHILYDFYNNTIEGLINAIAILHFEYTCFNQELDELSIAKNVLEKRISFDNGSLDRNYSKMLHLIESENYED